MIQTASPLDPRIRPGRAPTPAVRLRDVTAGYGDRVALADVDLDVPTGSLLAVIGPNGAGKSTLLKIIAGLLDAVAPGRSRSSADRRGVAAQRVAYVPQAEAVDWEFPVTVGDVVMMGRVPAHRDRPAAAAATTMHVVGDALETVGHGRRTRPPDRGAVGRPAAARLPGPGARGGARPLPARRAGDRCRRRRPRRT